MAALGGAHHQQAGLGLDLLMRVPVLDEVFAALAHELGPVQIGLAHHVAGNPEPVSHDVQRLNGAVIVQVGDGVHGVSPVSGMPPAWVIAGNAGGEARAGMATVIPALCCSKGPRPQGGKAGGKFRADQVGEPITVRAAADAGAGQPLRQ